MYPEHFTSFLEALRTTNNQSVLNTIHQGYQTIFETLHHKLKGTTSKDDGHTHTYIVNDQGNGKTSHDGNHHHDVKDWKVNQANNHKHRLELDPALMEAMQHDPIEDILKPFNITITPISRKIKDLTITPVSSIDTEEYQDLKIEILNDGVVPVLVHNNQVLDGNHRIKILESMKIGNIPTLDLKGDMNKIPDNVWLKFLEQYSSYTNPVKI